MPDAFEALHTLLDHEGVRAACSALLAGQYEQLTSTLPRLVSAESAADLLRGPATLAVLGRTPFALEELGLIFGHPGAHTLVDRVLGGGALSGERQTVPEPTSEGECGVLAYFIARLLAELSSGYVLRDVRAASRDELRAGSVGKLLWPLSLTGSLGGLELGVLLSREAAEALPVRFTLALALHDSVPAGLLDTLQPGDVLASDALSLLVATDGLHGSATLHVAGCAEPRSARISGSSARASHERASVPEGSALRLQLARREVTLWELGEIVAGSRPAFEGLTWDAVRLVHNERMVGDGELAVHRGALCVKLNRRESAA
jgi:hypothetical protein